MAKYLLKRLVRGILSVIAVVILVMLLVYLGIDRDVPLSRETKLNAKQNNAYKTYQYLLWEKYGYLDYVPYKDYLISLEKKGKIDTEKREEVAALGETSADDSAEVQKYVQKFTAYYKSHGYKVIRLDVVKDGKKTATGGKQELFAYKDKPIFSRVWEYFKNLISIDNIHYADSVKGKRGIKFTLHDPVYGGKKFSPAIIGNGTKHKYLLYFDNQFPFIHQNLFNISLGDSISAAKGDIWENMTSLNGSAVVKANVYPTGNVFKTSDDLHTATYIKGSNNSEYSAQRFTDDYTNVGTLKNGKSKIGYSFTIGILAVIASYLLGVPLGILMARKKDKFADKLGTLYIVFIIAVPSLAYILMFKAIGSSWGLPSDFTKTTIPWQCYILPIVSLALPSIAGLMKWLRRYTIDQMNSDYVRFARAGGLSEGEIFSKHVLKNAAIPIIHGIPGEILGSMVGAIITERIYTIPGAGGLLTDAIEKYDNGVIVGMTLFYASLSVISIILGDILMAMADPRISFSEKGR